MKVKQSCDGHMNNIKVDWLKLANDFSYRKLRIVINIFRLLEYKQTAESLTGECNVIYKFGKVRVRCK